MTVTGVGWALLGHVFFVVVIVGVGGQAMMVGHGSDLSSLNTDDV